MGGYDYAGNNPTTGSDPTGLCPVDKCGYGSADNGQIAQNGPVDPSNPNAGSYHNGTFQPPPKPTKKPNPVAHRQPNTSASNTAGGKASGEFSPDYPQPHDTGNSLIDRIAIDIADSFLLFGIPITTENPNATTDANPSCGPNSFTGTTPVLMADGASKQIEQVKVGDKIANATPGSLWGTKDQAHTVTAVHVTYTDHDYTDVTVNTTQGPATITGTTHHLYWDATTHIWTAADHLHVGDQLQSSDGAPVTILAVHDYAATTVTYNLTIDTLHTYYVVAGSAPILVHNDNSCINTDRSLGNDPANG